MKIRSLITATLALTLLSGTVFAQNHWNNDDDRYDNRRWEEHNWSHRHDAPARVMVRHHWMSGERLPREYSDRRYEVTDWRARHWKRPRHGYHYVQTDEGDIVLAAIATGVITDIALRHR